MRVVLTTVKSANVKVEGKTVGEISKGFLLLVGFSEGDDKLVVEKMIDKILSLRVFPDENGQINLSLKDVNGEILSVSQFTLYADCRKGRRPSFNLALRNELAKPLYEYFNSLLKSQYDKVECGIFQADMKVESINDGPFTLFLDSKELIK